MKRIYILLIGAFVASALMIAKPAKGETVWSSMEKTEFSTLSGDVLVINFNSVEYSLPMVKGFRMIYDNPVLGVMVSGKVEIGEGGNSPPILKLYALRTKNIKGRSAKYSKEVDSKFGVINRLNPTHFV